MISVILYGRNDSHGYNLHKRAAISLNCIAEVLSDAGDEIIFVDYNTPNDLPTFIEAIYDTLTPRAKSMLRVLRVRPAIHAAHLQNRTHLLALEPHSRNIGIRRSNPKNRWVLFTNTDMIFVPRGDVVDLPAAVRDLPDGQYILPRFELPEPLWEGFPRTDPQVVMRACDALGRKLHLEEVALTHPYMRFDSPGDFQLVPRQTLFEIHGFDERMIDGWHADSNMCKRLNVLNGRQTFSLAHRLKGYHCDHTRVATLAHRLDIKLENDLQEFVYGVEDPYATHQAETWGMPDENIEEVDFCGGPAARFITAVDGAIGFPQEEEYYSNAIDLRNFVRYQPEHALPYLAGNLTVYPLEARFAYIGNNPRMLSLVGKCVAGMGFTHPLEYVAEQLTAGPVTGGSARPVESAGEIGLPAYLLANYDLLIFDFGLDDTGLKLPRPVRRVTQWPRELRYSLGRIAGLLEDCAESDLPKQRRRPEFVVLNANHHVFSQFVSQFLVATETPYNTHVRKGRARVGDERLYRSHRWMYTRECMRSYFGYGARSVSVPQIAPGQTIDLTTSGCAAAHKEGDWGWMDGSGTWSDGARAEILFSPAPSVNTDLIAFVRIVETYLGPDGDPIRINVFLDGELLVRWRTQTRYGACTYKVVLPLLLMQRQPVCRLTFQIENPQSVELMATLSGQQTIGEDPRELGVKVQRITIAGTDLLRYPVGNTIDFTEKGKGVFHMNESWTQPDNLGSWTLGPQAQLVLFLVEPRENPAVAWFTITDVAVNEQYQHVTVSVAFNGKKMAEWQLGPNRLVDERKVFVPSDVLRQQSPLIISFQIDAPHTPVELKWSETDTRQLGFRLTRFRMESIETPRYRIGDTIEFVEGAESAGFLGPQWAAPDYYGAWTVGPEASMTLQFETPPVGPIPASFVVSDCMVSGNSPSLPVRVKANGQPVAEWILGPDRVPHTRSIELPASVMQNQRELTLAFEIPEPRTPASLGWSADARPLGFRIARALFGPGDLEVPDFAQRSIASGVDLGTRTRKAVFAALQGLRTAMRGAQ